MRRSFALVPVTFGGTQSIPALFLVLVGVPVFFGRLGGRIVEWRMLPKGCHCSSLKKRLVGCVLDSVVVGSIVQSVWSRGHGFSCRYVNGWRSSQRLQMQLLSWQAQVL